jgi:hypothetical protein
MPTHKPRSHSEERVALHVRLAWEASAGHLDGLQCPECRQAAVSVWFTHPAEDTYRTWFVCDHCHYRTRAQCTERPPFFSEDRVNAELQERDLAGLKWARSMEPPQRFM